MTVLRVDPEWKWFDTIILKVSNIKNKIYTPGALSEFICHDNKINNNF